MFSKLPWLPNFHRKSLVTLFLAYVALVGVVTLAILLIYALLLPGSLTEGFSWLKRAISASFGLGNYLEATPSSYKASPSAVVIIILFIHAFSILMLNMIFQAVITAKLIKPAIDLRVSDGVVFNPSYGLDNTKSPHILFRLVNAGAFDLHLVSLKAFLTVHQEHPNDASQSMLYYFPVPAIDPLEIPVLRPLTPWIIAIPVETPLTNSIVDDYQPSLTRASGSKPGKRQLEILVSGNETEASTSFLKAFNLDLEIGSPHGLICGRFQSLPCTMTKQELSAINTRIPNPAGVCTGCPDTECRFRTHALTELAIKV
jgi:hypothetical protein